MTDFFDDTDLVKVGRSNIGNLSEFDREG